MRKIVLTGEGRYNYHNMVDIDIRCADNMAITMDGIIVGYELTASQIKRIKRHYCGISDCCCGSRPLGYEEIDYDRAIINI